MLGRIGYIATLFLIAVTFGIGQRDSEGAPGNPPPPAKQQTNVFWESITPTKFNSPGGEIVPRISFSSLPSDKIESGPSLENSPVADIEPDASCKVIEINIGDTINKRLNNGDCGTDRHFDQYAFTANAGQAVDITMSSTAFDTSLELYGPDGQLVASSSSGPFSRVLAFLHTSGSYLVIASSALANQAGPYALHLGSPRTISGIVTVVKPDTSIAPFGGTVVTATNQTGTFSTSAVSGPDGFYVLYFPDITDTYTVAAAPRDGYVLSDPLGPVVVTLTQNQVINFRFTQLQITVTGGGRVGVRSLSTAGLRVFVTGANILPTDCLLSIDTSLQNEVMYDCIGLPLFGSYTVTRKSTFFVFEPESIQVDNLSVNLLNFDFPGPTYVINPVPTIAAVSPDTIVAKTTDLTITVTGSNFVNGSLVRWNGQDRLTTYVSAMRLTAQVPAADIQAGGINQISVSNPAYGGGPTPSSVPLTVNNPPPVVDSLGQTSAPAGGLGFELIVNGAGFNTQSVVRWNDQDRPTTALSLSQLKASIQASDIQAAGQSSISVFNPLPGGGMSNALSFSIETPAVTVTVQTDPAGLPIVVDGSSYTSPQTFATWASGSPHTISTTQTQGDSQTRYNFAAWSDGGAIAHTVSPASSMTFTATFGKQHFLTMVAELGGTVSPQSNWFDAGQQIQIQATPDDHYSFSGWTGNGYSGTDNPAVITVDRPVIQSAAFSLVADTPTPTPTPTPDPTATPSPTATPAPSPTPTITPTPGPTRRTRFDFDGDGSADLAVFRPTDNVWYLLRSTAGFTAIQFGAAGDLLVPADYDGDGITDVAVFRSATGIWFVAGSSSGFSLQSWGQDGDIPVPADFDGDGRADLAVFRPAAGTWFRKLSADDSIAITQFGTAEDKPQIGDFDGDGKADLAVLRPSNNVWYFLRSSLGFTAFQWGAAGDIPAPADYDGDGRTDVAVFRPSTGVWFIAKSTAGFSQQTWGAVGDIPAAGDYDGDGKSDLAVFRPSDSIWYLARSSAGIGIFAFGSSGDIALPSVFAP